MCDTRQHDVFIEGVQEDAITQVPLKASTKDTKESGECGEVGWRRIAKLAEAETDPDKLMDLAQQLVDEMDREAATMFVATLKSFTGVSKVSEEGQ